MRSQTVSAQVATPCSCENVLLTALGLVVPAAAPKGCTTEMSGVSSAMSLGFAFVTERTPLCALRARACLRTSCGARVTVC